MTTVQVNNNSSYYEVSSKTYVEITGITVSMWKQHNFETIFTSDDVLNIQYATRKDFYSGERVFYTRVNAYFDPIRTNIPHATTIYGTGK